MEEKFIIRYNKSFIAKLSLLSDRMKMIYEQLKNELLSYDSVKVRGSWDKERFYVGRKTLCYLTARGKILKLYLALNFNEIDEDFGAIDQSGVKKYESTPVLIKIKGPRSLKKALTLVEELMENEERDKVEEVLESYYDLYKTRTFEELLAEELIKPVYGKQEGMPVTVDFMALDDDDEDGDEDDDEEEEEIILKEIPLSLVDADYQASYCYEGYTKNVVARNLRGTINLKDLEDNFEDGEVVDIESLQEKGLISPYTIYVKLLGDGELTKKLDIRLNDYSKQAISKLEELL